MKTRIAASTDGTDERLVFWCPGCNEAHAPRVKGVNPWQWNGDRERPTLAPSILVRGTRPITDDEYDRIRRGEPITAEPRVCHSFVRDGQIQFLDDCTHALKGQTVAIPEWPLGEDV